MTKKEFKQARRARERADSSLGFKMLAGWIMVIILIMVFLSW
jgi:hypothetical protein